MVDDVPTAENRGETSTQPCDNNRAATRGSSTKGREGKYKYIDYSRAARKKYIRYLQKGVFSVLCGTRLLPVSDYKGSAPRAATLAQDKEECN